MLKTNKKYLSKQKLWIFLLLFSLWSLSISGVFGNEGLLQAYRLSQVRRDLALRVKALDNEKKRLESYQQALEKDPYVQEQVIRQVLGFVRADELVFEF